ncbi:hypothetical protein LWP59_22230 [Amycolatopsis acidiphila]|nr:hypothetical protein [Amycolatopsis acidiphila]UIJ56886.1 hypothetical protein LWP59_22230 [Amycolatopsis acidiphila]GHG54559.1 hypothetical protein GCM10017788_04360 [Amycolatopsis acidiphila]
MPAQALGAVSGLLADAATFAVALVCLLRIRAPEPRGATARSLREEIAIGLRWTPADPHPRAPAAFGCLTNLGLTGFQALQVLFLVGDLHAIPAAGVVAANVVIGAFQQSYPPTAIPGPRDRDGHRGELCGRPRRRHSARDAAAPDP